MSYVNSVLQPGERIIRLGHLHWIVYWHAIVLAVLAVLFAAWRLTSDMGHMGNVMSFVAMAFGVLAVVAFGLAWFKRWITEIAVTDRRIIYKRGFINRHTVEMNMDKVAGVDVDQSILGRLLDYGTICVLSAGGAQAPSGPDRPRGIEHLHRVASPLTLRNAITAK
jgi:uncharacterized membrane protein YdbT with pleckstrin-like domain